LLKLVQPPEIFIESFEFDHEIETVEPLLFILRRFLEQLALRLNSIYLVARELTLTIHFSRSEAEGHFAARQSLALPTEAYSYHRTFKIPEPTNDVDLLFRMLQTHLENFKSEHPIVAVALRAEPSRPASQQFGLFETALRNPHQLYETLARLIALVGNDRVGTPVIEETHWPDAFRMEPFVWSLGGTSSVPSNSSDTTERVPQGSKPALRRFRPPMRTSIFSERRVNQAGPFLLSGNWWDEKAWARAEWDVQLKNGDLIRAYESAGVWEIDGIYD
jgi:protein ImuB